MARRGTRGGKNRSKSKAAIGSTVKKHVPGGGLATKSPANHLGAGWDGATSSPRRGYVVWPTLDSTKDLPPASRVEIIRKVRMAAANIGLVKRCIKGPSKLIGTARPQAKTPDREFNKRAEEAFWRRAKNPAAFDYAGKLNFIGWQNAIKLAKSRDGDAVTALGEGPSGGGRVMFYESHQIGDGNSGKPKPENLRDGVYLDKHGGRAGFRILKPGAEDWFNLARENAIYHGDPDQHARPRSVSGMAHAVSNFLDMVEIIADTKHAIKVAALWGVAMEQKSTEASKKEMDEQLRAYINGSGPAGVDAETGEVLTVDKITQGGRVQGLPAGASLKTVQDQRPHPNQLQLMSWLVRDMAHGRGLFPEVLWDLSGLNGTSMRYAMADTRRFIEDEQELLEMEFERVWLYFLAKEIKEGRLELPDSLKGQRWWNVGWQWQADMTIDRGREGKLEMEMVAKEYMTRQEMWGRRGKDWEEEEWQLRLERKRLAEMDAEIAGE